MLNKEQSKKKQALKLFADANNLVADKRYLEAIQKYEIAIHITPPNDHFNVGYLYYNLAVCNLCRITQNKERAAGRKLTILFEAIDFFLKYKEEFAQLLGSLKQKCKALLEAESNNLINELDEKFIEVLSILQNKSRNSFKKVERKFSKLITENEIGFDGEVIRFHTEFIEIWDEIVNISRVISLSSNQYKQSVYAYLNKLLSELLESYYLMTDEDLDKNEKDWSLPVDGTEAMLLAIFQDMKTDSNNTELKEKVTLFLLYYYRKYGDFALNEKNYKVAIENYKMALTYSNLIPENECAWWYRCNIYYNLGVCHSDDHNFNYESAKAYYIKSKKILRESGLQNTYDNGLQMINSALKELKEKKNSFNNSGSETSYRKINTVLQICSSLQGDVPIFEEKDNQDEEMIDGEKLDTGTTSSDYKDINDNDNSNELVKDDEEALGRQGRAGGAVRHRRTN